MKRKILAILLTCMMTVTAIPAMAFAAGGDGSGGGTGSGSGGGNGSGSTGEDSTVTEASVKIKGGVESITLEEGQTGSWDAKVEGTSDEDYHVHWTKQGGKKYLTFLVDGKPDVETLTVAGTSAQIQGIAANSALTLELAVIKGADHTACEVEGAQIIKLASTKIPVTVTAKATSTGYGPQGKEGGTQTLKMMNPAADSIQVVRADAASGFDNRITTPFPADRDMEFAVQYGKEMGEQYSEDAFVNNTLAKVTVTDKAGKIVAGTEKGNLVYTGYESNPERMAKFKINANTLTAGTYVMTFPAACYMNGSNNTIGIPITFEFTVEGEPPVTEPTDPNKSIISGVNNTTFGLTVSAAYGKNTVKWTKNKYGNTAYRVDKVTVYRSKTGKAGTWGKVLTSTKASGTYTDTKLTKGQKYYYKVRGQRTISSRVYYTKYSGAKYCTAKGTYNQYLGSLVAATKINAKSTAGKNKVTVSWTKKGSAKITSYQVYRSTKKNSGYKKVLTTSRTKVTSTKLKKGKTYYFKVRGVRKIGGKTYYTKWSNITYRKVK